MRKDSVIKSQTLKEKMESNDEVGLAGAKPGSGVVSTHQSNTSSLHTATKNHQQVKPRDCHGCSLRFSVYQTVMNSNTVISFKQKELAPTMVVKESRKEAACMKE